MDIKLIAKLLVVKTQAKGALQVTRRPDTLVSPVGRPGPEQRRDLIGARRLPGVTPHSTSSVLSRSAGCELTATSRGAF